MNKIGKNMQTFDIKWNWWTFSVSRTTFFLHLFHIFHTYIKLNNRRCKRKESHEIVLVANSQHTIHSADTPKTTERNCQELLNSSDKIVDIFCDFRRIFRFIKSILYDVKPWKYPSKMESSKIFPDNRFKDSNATKFI